MRPLLRAADESDCALAPTSSGPTRALPPAPSFLPASLAGSAELLLACLLLRSMMAPTMAAELLSPIATTAAPPTGDDCASVLGLGLGGNGGSGGGNGLRAGG